MCKVRMRNGVPHALGNEGVLSEREGNIFWTTTRSRLALETCLRRPINGSTISLFCFSFYIPVSRFFLFQFFVFQFCVIHILCFISTLFLYLHHFYCCIIYLQSLSTQIYKPAIHFLPCSAVARSFTDALSKFPV